MPQVYSLCSLVDYLKEHVVGSSHSMHNFRAIQKEMAKWFPRPEEYQQYVHWNPENPKAYTRNLIFHNENMDVILMCWPAGTLLGPSAEEC